MVNDALTSTAGVLCMASIGTFSGFNSITSSIEPYQTARRALEATGCAFEIDI